MHELEVARFPDNGEALGIHREAFKDRSYQNWTQAGSRCDRAGAMTEAD